jgi:hypothetical protein
MSAARARPTLAFNPRRREAMSHATRELDRSDWERFFTTAAALLPPSEISVEVRTGAAYYTEAESMMLATLLYDARSDVFEVAGVRGGAYTPQVLRHFVTAPRRISVDCRGSGPPGWIEVEADDGDRTLVHIAAVSTATG